MIDGKSCEGLKSVKNINNNKKVMKYFKQRELTANALAIEKVQIL